MKSILVTGVAGFIGHKVTENLLLKGYRVIGIDNLNNYYDPRLKKLRLNELEKLCKKNQLPENAFEFHQVDIENKGDLHHILQSNYRSTSFYLDAIINLAARAGVRYSMDNPDIYFSTNTVGSLNLLEFAKYYKIEKFVLASTSSLYAGQSLPFSEDLPVNTPISPYAASKKAAEVLSYTYHYLYNIDVSIVRYFTVYGPGGRPDMCIFRFIKWIDEGRPIDLYGDGMQSRDFTYISDIAAGTLAALKKVNYEIINLGGGHKPTNLLYIIQTIEKALRKKSKINYLPFHKTDIIETMADISKAKRLLDSWKPIVSIDEGLEECIKWYFENKQLVSTMEL